MSPVDLLFDLQFVSSCEIIGYPPSLMMCLCVCVWTCVCVGGGALGACVHHTPAGSGTARVNLVCLLQRCL